MSFWLGVVCFSSPSKGVSLAERNKVLRKHASFHGSINGLQPEGIEDSERQKKHYSLFGFVDPDSYHPDGYSYNLDHGLIKRASRVLMYVEVII